MSFFEILGELSFRGTCISLRGPASYWPMSYKQLTSCFLSFIFNEDLMKNLYFSSKIHLAFFFCDPCFYATLQKFRPLVTCNNPGHDIKRPRKNLFSIKFISGW